MRAPTWVPWKLSPDSDPQQRWILVSAEDDREEHPVTRLFETEAEAIAAAKEETMSAPKHTPGPWKAYHKYTCHSIIERDGKTLFETDCALGKSAEDEAETRANAELAAASPQMLESLQKISDGDPLSASCGDDPALCKLNCMGCIARAAIAAARGER